MQITPTPLAGAMIVDLDAHVDERGFFARTFCRDEFADLGLDGAMAQCSVSFNAAKGTLRGMHWQDEPQAETKLVRCTSGAIFDVIVDVRRGTPGFGRWFGIALTARNHRALYVPKGFAHGFVTLEPDTEVFYQISVSFVPGHLLGFRWNDPAVAIEWPMQPLVISDRDAAYPALTDVKRAAP